MNQKGIKLSQLINQRLSDENNNKINQIIKNKEAKPLDKYIFMKMIVFHGTVCGDF